MDGCELENGGEDEEETYANEEIKGCRIGHLRQVLSVVDSDEGHCQNGRDSCNATRLEWALSKRRKPESIRVVFIDIEEGL